MKTKTREINTGAAAAAAAKHEIGKQEVNMKRRTSKKRNKARTSPHNLDEGENE